MDTGHTKSGLALCLLRVPSRGSVDTVGLALLLVLPFPGAGAKIAPDDSGEQAYSEMGEGCRWLLSHE